MNKKILILPLVVTTLGLTSCKKKDDTVTDTTSIATQMYEASVASAKSLNNFKISTNVSDSNMKFQYRTLNKEAAATKPCEETYDADLKNVSLESNLRIGGLQLLKYKKVTTEEGEEIVPYNQNFKAQLELKNIVTKGNVYYANVRQKPCTIENDKCTISFDDTDKIESLNAYINRKAETEEAEKLYNAYVNFGSSDVELSKFKYDYHDSPYAKAESNIENRVKAVISLISDWNKRYIGISELAKIPYLGKIIATILEKISEDGLGLVGEAIKNYGNGTEPKKEDCVEYIKKSLDALNEQVGQVLTMTVTDNKPCFTFNLDCEHLNKFTDSDCFYNGNVSITVSVDDAKRISNIGCAIEGLKTNKYLDIVEDVAQIYFSDFSLKLNTSISYDLGYDSFSNDVDKDTTGFKPFSIK